MKITVSNCEVLETSALLSNYNNISECLIFVPNFENHYFWNQLNINTIECVSLTWGINQAALHVQSNLTEDYFRNVQFFGKLNIYTALMTHFILYYLSSSESSLKKRDYFCKQVTKTILFNTISIMNQKVCSRIDYL